MSQLLKTLSELLETQRPMLTADDLAAMDDAARDLLLDLGILVPAQPATHVACDACHDDHIEEVARIKDCAGTVFFRIRCPDAGWIDVAEERLRQWAIDSGRLASTLAVAIGSSGTPSELIRGSAWRIGAIEIAGESYDVVFFRNGSFADESLGDELRRKIAPARTIVVGTYDPPDEAGFAASMRLDLAFTVTGNRIEVQIARIRSLIAANSVVAGNVFQLRGDFWQLSFEGMTQFLKDSVGMGYIARLLREPNRDIPAVVLLAERAEIDPLVASGSLGETVDDTGRKNFRERCEDLPAELQKARENHDDAQVSRLEAELEGLIKLLENAEGLGGRRREATDADRVRKAVSAAVTRDIERIGNKHEALGRHLLAAVSQGLSFRYAPEREIDWLV